MTKPTNQTGEIKLVAPSALRPNPKNPNTHSTEQIKRIAEVIREQGFRVPIVVSKRSNLVIAGHGRLKASLELGLDAVPVAYQDFATEAEENLHMLADNRLAELAEMDNSMLKDIIQELDTGEIDLNLTGFSQEEIGSLMSQYFQGDDLGDDPHDKLEIMKNTQLRQLLLIMKEEEFNEIIDKLEALKNKHGYENNNECIMTLIRNAE